MNFQQCLWDLEEQEPQEISQDECAQIYNRDPVYYFGKIDNKEQDREQFKQAKQQLIELLEKVTNTIPDQDPNATDHQGNPKPIDKRPLINFRHKVYNHFTYNISLDTRQSLLNPVKKELEDLYTNHAARLEQAKGFTPNTLELNLNDQDFNICWQGVANKLREFIDSVRLDKSFHQLVVKAKRQMLWGLASFYVASNRYTWDSEVHATARYFNCLALTYGLTPINWESRYVNDPDNFLKYVHYHQDNAFWEKLIALIDDFFPQELGDGISPFERVRELMDEVVPKDNNNSAWLRFFMGDVTEESSLSSGLEEQTRQRLARLCTSYLMAQQGYLSPDYCRTLNVKVVHNSDNNQNRADNIEVLSSKRLLPDNEQWSQHTSDQPGGDQEVSDNHNIEAVYYYLTSEDIFIHIDGVIRPASQADLRLIKDDLKNYQLRVPAANLQYLDRDFILELNCLPSITMPSLGISLSSDSQKLLEVLASDHALKNHIKQQFIQHYKLLMRDLEGVNPDPNYKIKSPLLNTLFWQLYKDNLNNNELTNDDSQCFRQLTGCSGIATLYKLNNWLINNTDHPFLQGTDNLSTINHLFWQVYEAYCDEDQFLPKDTLFFQMVTGNSDLKSQSGVQDWLIESVVRGESSRADLPFSLILFAAQNDYKQAVQDFFNNCLNKRVAWQQFSDTFGRNILHISMCQFDIAYEFLCYVPIENSPPPRSLGASYELSSRISHDSLSIDVFKKSNQFDNKSLLQYIGERGLLKALDWLTHTVYNNNMTQLLLDLVGRTNMTKYACQLALANNQQAFLRRFFYWVIQKKVIKSNTGTDDIFYLYDRILAFFLNTNENKIELLTHALSQGIIAYLENTSELKRIVNSQLTGFLLKFSPNYVNSLLDIIIQHKQCRFFQALINNNRSRELVFRLFEENPYYFDLFLQDKHNHDSLSALVKQLTYEQFMSLFIDNFGQTLSHSIVYVYQKIAANNSRQVFLNRCFHLIVQRATRNNDEIKHEAHRDTHTVFKDLLNKTNNDDDHMAYLIKALIHGIKTHLLSIDCGIWTLRSLESNARAIMGLLLANHDVNYDNNLLHSIIQHQSVNFFDELLSHERGYHVILKLLGLGLDSLTLSESRLLEPYWELMFTNDNCEGFVNTFKKRLKGQNLSLFLEICLNQNVVQKLLAAGHHHFLEILGADWLLDKYFGGATLRIAANVDNAHVLDTYADLIHDNSKIEYLLENYNVLYFAFTHQHSTEFTYKLFGLWTDIAKRLMAERPSRINRLPEEEYYNGLRNPLSLIFVEDNAAQLQRINEALNNPAQLKECLQKKLVSYTGKVDSLGSFALSSLKQGKPDKDNSEVLLFLLANYKELTKTLLTEKASFNGGSPILEMFEIGMSSNDLEAIKTHLGADFFKHLLKNEKDRYNENVLHYALKGYELGDTVCQQARITNSINTLFADHPDIVKDLLKKPSKSEWGYFSRGETPIYHIVQKGYHEILDTAIYNIGQDEFLKLLKHNSIAFYYRVFLDRKPFDTSHRINCIFEFICKLRAYYNEDQIVPFLDSTAKGDHIKPFQDILLSMCQYHNNDHAYTNRLKDFLSQFGTEHIDQLLLNDGGENNKIIMNLSNDLSGYYYDDEVKTWYSSVFHQLDQHSTIMPTLLMQKPTADSMPYWQAFQSSGLIDNNLSERLEMDSSEKIEGHMRSLLTAITKQKGVRGFKRNEAQRCLDELDNINAQGNNAREDLKELFERVVIQMGKHQFWRQGINADKATSAVNTGQLPNTLKKFYDHFDTMRQQAFGISDEQWCGLLKGERPRHNVSNNPNVSSSPHGTFGSGHGQQPPEPQLESDQPGQQL